MKSLEEELLEINGVRCVESGAVRVEHIGVLYDVDDVLRRHGLEVVLVEDEDDGSLTLLYRSV